MTSRCLVKDDGTIRVHEHFCLACYGHGKLRRSGWWRCVDKKCVNLPSSPCKKHRS